jgi:hypothetical protein
MMFLSVPFQLEHPTSRVWRTPPDAIDAGTLKQRPQASRRQHQIALLKPAIFCRVEYETHQTHYLSLVIFRGFYSLLS